MTHRRWSRTEARGWSGRSYEDPGMDYCAWAPTKSEQLCLRCCRIGGSLGRATWVGALVLLSRLRAPAEVFNRSKVWAVAGLTVGFGLWFFGFMVIAGEYFAMWQSKIWNGQDAAFRIATVILGVLVFVSLPD